MAQDMTAYYELQKVRESEKYKDLIVATTSHELRTPLNGIMTMLELLKSKIKKKGLLKYLKYAESSAKLMFSLVNDMLDFSTINANKFKKKIDLLNIRELIQEASSILKYQIEEKGVSVKFDFAPNVP